MAIFTEYYCRSLLEDSVILPQEIKDAIKKKIKNWIKNIKININLIALVKFSIKIMKI